MSDAPFFIVGASRSGTTLLRLLLNAHSRLAVPPELKYFNRTPRDVWRSGWRLPALSEREFESLVRSFLRNRAEVFDEIDTEAIARKVLDAPDRDLRTPYQMAAEAWASHHGKARWGEKTPVNLYWVDILADMFPESRFIYLVRDPRAVVSSMNRSPYYGKDTGLNALNWLRATTAGYDRLLRFVPSERRYVLHYETLVRSPEPTVSAVCSFLGERFEPSMLEFYHDAPKYLPDLARRATVPRPVSTDALERWREELLPEETALVEHLCAVGMERFGYEPSGESLPLALRVEAGTTRAYWRLQQWRHRDRRGYEAHTPVLGRTRTRIGLAPTPRNPANVP